MYSVAKKYSDAFFGVFREDVIVQTTQILKRLSYILESSKGGEIFNSPFVSATSKEKLLSKLLEDLKGNLDEGDFRKLANFTRLLLQKNRLANLYQIVAQIEKRTATNCGVFNAYISTSATPSEENLDKIKTKLEEELGVKLILHIKKGKEQEIKIDIPSLELQGSFKRDIFLNTLKQNILKAI